VLLEFRTKNYKSFKEEIKFSMVPADKIQDLSYSVLTKKVYGKQKNKYKNIKGLCAAVVYGPNSAGKTNLIGAMDVLRSIVLRGHIRNADKESISPNVAKYAMELIPNIDNRKNVPVEFSVKFIKGNYLIEYHLSVDIGGFLEKDKKRRIVNEKLCINNEEIFDRTDKLNIGDLSVIDKELVKGYSIDSADTIINIAKNNLNPEEMFLTTMFKSTFSNNIANMIIEWFEADLAIIYRADSVHSFPEADDGENQLITSPVITKALKEFGFSAEDFGYVKVNENEKTKPVSIIKTNEGKTIGVPVEDFESFGTARFMNVLPILITALRKGQTVVIDEFDASIHPMALMSIVNVFHNDEINVNGAQLIFNTHNPIFLNRNLFRRDEIKFIERDYDNKNSTHYALSDFGTTGPNAVRNTSDYMKNYFISQYGAIRDIDFSDIFAEAINSKEAVD
jgi:AAA15 family ATPase/GTPase